MATPNLIEPNPPQQFAIFWLDSAANSSEENLMVQQKLYGIFDNVEIFEEEDVCRKLIQSKPKQPVILIVSGRLSRQIVPVIDPLEHVLAIYIYCMDENRHKEWATAFLKVIFDFFLFGFDFLFFSS
jgi:hypothetical protein